MAQFVNFKKRGITLPPGCKDLIDVMVPSRRQGKSSMATVGFPPLEIKEERFPTAGLAQVGRYVSMLLQFSGEQFTLSITAEGLDYPVTLFRSKSEKTATIVLIAKEQHQEQAIRAFFEQQSINTLLDYPPSAFSGEDAVRGLGYPLPSEASRATCLMTELLRTVYGLSNEAGIDFRYYEMETAPGLVR